MRISIRKAFATLLVVCALVPTALVVGFFVAQPVVVYSVAEFGARWLMRLVWVVLVVVGLGLFVYPPFLPFVRMRLTAIRRRLGTDRGPLFDGLARLRHLETHADRLQVGRLARQLGDTAVALENLSRAFELDPRHVSGRYQFGLLLADLGRHADAANLLQSVVIDDEKHAFGDALFHLGRSLFRLHRDTEALAVLRRHQALFPGNRQVHLLAARVLAAEGDLAAARNDLQAAARPFDGREHLSPEENLARARAKVTFLRRGKSGG